MKHQHIGNFQDRFFNCRRHLQCKAFALEMENLLLGEQLNKFLTRLCS